MVARAPTTIYLIGMPARDDNSRSSQAFTLIELILVMALLATLLAIAAPSLSRSFKGRNLDQEATQLLAATEYARDEAVSQGVPMSVWIDPETGDFGVQARDGYEGDALRERSWTLNPDLHFEAVKATADKSGRTVAVQFEPDGTLDPESLDAIRVIASSEESISLTQTDDGWGYEIVK